MIQDSHWMTLFAHRRFDFITINSIYLLQAECHSFINSVVAWGQGSRPHLAGTAERVFISTGLCRSCLWYVDNKDQACFCFELQSYSAIFTGGGVCLACTTLACCLVSSFLIFFEKDGLVNYHHTESYRKKLIIKLTDFWWISLSVLCQEGVLHYIIIKCWHT